MKRSEPVLPGRVRAPGPEERLAPRQPVESRAATDRDATMERRPASRLPALHLLAFSDPLPPDYYLG